MKKVIDVAKGLNKRYPEGNEPFQIIARLAEECGELAKEVNIWEGTGIKKQKHEGSSRQKVADEVKNVMTCALQVALYYGAEQEVMDSVIASYQRLQAEGHIG